MVCNYNRIFYFKGLIVMNNKIENLFAKAKREEFDNLLFSSLKTLGEIISDSRIRTKINIQAHINKAFILSSIYRSSEALEILQDLEKNIKDKKLLIQYIYIKAFVLSDIGSHPQALDLIKNETDIEFSYLRGLIYFRMGDHSKSEFYCRKALEDNKEKYNLIKAASYRMLAIVSTVQNEFIRAIENHSLALMIYKKMNYKRGLIKEYMSLGTTYLNMGEPKLAGFFLKKSQHLAEEGEDKAFCGLLASKLGHLELDKGNVNKALEYYNEDLENSKSTQNYLIKAHIYRNIGRAYRIAKNFTKAIESFQQSQLLLKKCNSKFNKYACAKN